MKNKDNGFIFKEFTEWMKKGKKINDNDLKPSAVIDRYWLFAKNMYLEYDLLFLNNNPYSGKWLVFVSINKLDELWEKIRLETIRGNLGTESKTSTAKSNPNATNSDKVICVYTNDYRDKTDVMRVREELRELGVINKIQYKSDQTTLEGKYKNNGSNRISLYYE